MSGELRFSWRRPDGQLINWWSDDLARDQRRFVYNHWGVFNIAVDLNQREAQLDFLTPPERLMVTFSSIIDEDSRLALEAVCDARQAAFAAELLLRLIGRDDLADKVLR